MMGLALLLSQHWEHEMSSSPTWATRLGDHRFDERLGDNSLEAVAARQAQLRSFREQAEALQGLEGEDAVTREIFVLTLKSEEAKAACRFETWSVSARNNPVGMLEWLPQLHPQDTPQDRDNLMARYRALPAYIRVSGDNLRVGLGEGRVQNATSLARVIALVDGLLARPTAEWEPVEMAPEGAYRDQVAALMEAELRPALKAYRDLLERELLPKARRGDQVGLVGLPEGEACYEAVIFEHLAMEKSPEELHQTGLSELERIHAEMAVIGGRLWGITELPAIQARLRSPEMHFETEEQVEAKAREALARAEAAVPAVFQTLPEAPCEVWRIPETSAPYTTIAYYQPTNGTDAGRYYVNTYEPHTRPRYDAEVLAFHEAVPGHHFQIARAVELPELPDFRKHVSSTAYVEGWALYTERLSDELGLYSGDLDRLGMLSFDSWRASRLVVDTGIHHKGWTREQAEDFLRANTLLADNNIVNEVDRYITWPGQALAYKTGQLEILAMRARAEEVQGEAFDLAAFHELVLEGGAVPLPVLWRKLEAWLAE